jgi:hypothetical protein
MSVRERRPQKVDDDRRAGLDARSSFQFLDRVDRRHFAHDVSVESTGRRRKVRSAISRP